MQHEPKAITCTNDTPLVSRDLRPFSFGHVNLISRRRAADSAYGSAANLAWLVKERQIEPHIPVFDKSNRTDGTFSRSNFVFDPECSHYTCPQGKSLVRLRRTYAIPRSGITKDGTRLYRSSKSDCQACALQAKCCPNTPHRKVRSSTCRSLITRSQALCIPWTPWIGSIATAGARRAGTLCVTMARDHHLWPVPSCDSPRSDFQHPANGPVGVRCWHRAIGPFRSSPV
ncbi:MAG: transposase family protein [Tardiphaga sp.]|nr:transposase family protein [Tardiphaga sp.]